MKVERPEERAGKRTRRLRQDRGWSQEQLAQAMRERGWSWHQTTVAKSEAAERPLRFDEVVALAEIFDAPVEDFAAPEFGYYADSRPLDEHKADLLKLERQIARDEEAASLAREAAQSAQSAAAQLEDILRVNTLKRDYLARLIERMEAANGEHREEA